MLLGESERRLPEFTVCLWPFNIAATFVCDCSLKKKEKRRRSGIAIDLRLGKKIVVVVVASVMLHVVQIEVEIYQQFSRAYILILAQT